MMDAAERKRIEEILRYWFGDWDEKVPLAKDSPVARRWFSSTPALDEECRMRFEHDVVFAATEHYSRWMETAGGSAALVILLDQLPRNIHRGAPGAFAQDVMAQKVTRHTLEYGIDRQMTLPQRMFLLSPLMHAEAIEAHRVAEPHYRALVEYARAQGSANVPLYEQALHYAGRHRAIIERFGRYPHRNAILGRESTRDELEFLKQPGSSF
jgi:uncharacterized protein (DUF924 family)